jgi:ABC-type cobalamin/Fe3+-siderophores transport system ATPase subunit
VFADWFFSTDHIQLRYGLKYDGTDLHLLSPGTRGIVLLILYLAIDTADDRPLVIDQPEENLDPRSVYQVLRNYFRDARQRRQVLLVTHNANLVVNTDADQVIVAASSRQSGGGLLSFSYTAATIEDSAIRRHVCELLEGGEQAFREREHRYFGGRDR